MVSKIFDAVGWETPNVAALEGVDACIRQLSQVDLDSFAFRYPYSKKGDRSLPDTLSYINIRHFAEVMDRLASYIDGIDTGASVVEEWQDDLEAEWRNNMAGYGP